MEPIRLVVSDIDGTLLTSAKTISPATRHEIARVMASGVHFSIASGRPGYRLNELLDGLGIAVPIISSNGAVVEDLMTGEVFHSSHMANDLAQQVLALVADYDFLSSFLDSAEGWRYLTETRDLDPRVVALITELEATPIEDLQHYFAEEPVVRKLLIVGKERDLERMEQGLEGLEGVYVTSSLKGNREIMVTGADKANAAKILAARLGIAREQVLAIGDQRNDMELVAWAGIGVAMGNAVPELKALADWVTITNDEDGLAHALAHFIP